MSVEARGTFEVTRWEESPYEELGEGRRLTRASAEQIFHGDLEAGVSLELLMAYRPDGSASFVGLARVAGLLRDRAGRFVLQLSGIYDGQEARAAWFVVPGSGEGQLTGLQGQGGLAAIRGGQGTLTLDYSFA
jgi:hypothetical protein